MEKWGNNPHAMSNLACLCPECHGKKTATEYSLFEGDLIGFVDGLREMNYPYDRVISAFQNAGLNAKLVEKIYKITA